MRNQSFYGRFLAWCSAGKSLFVGVAVQETKEDYFDPNADNTISDSTDPGLNDHVSNITVDK